MTNAQAGTGDTAQPTGDANRVISDAIAEYWGYTDADSAARGLRGAELADLAGVSERALTSAGLLATRPAGDTAQPDGDVIEQATRILARKSGFDWDRTAPSHKEEARTDARDLASAGLLATRPDSQDAGRHTERYNPNHATYDETRAYSHGYLDGLDAGSSLPHDHALLASQRQDWEAEYEARDEAGGAIWSAARQAGTGDTAQPGDDVIEQAAKVLHEDDWPGVDWDENPIRQVTYTLRARALADAGLLATRPDDCGHSEHVSQRQIDACLATRPDTRDKPLPIDHSGVCRLCGSGILAGTGEHIRTDLSPCYGDQEPGQGNGDTEAFGTSSDCCDDPDCPCHDNDDPTGDRWADDVAAADRPATEAKGQDGGEQQ